MQPLSKYLPFGLFLAFLVFGLATYVNSKPSSKNERVYAFVKHYSPYYLEKRFGGLEIHSKTDKAFKEKPTNATLFKEFERLEKEWGQTHLKLQHNTLFILDDNGTVQATLPIQNDKERLFVQHYYGAGQ